MVLTIRSIKPIGNAGMNLSLRTSRESWESNDSREAQDIVERVQEFFQQNERLGETELAQRQEGQLVYWVRSSTKGYIGNVSLLLKGVFTSNGRGDRTVDYPTADSRIYGKNFWLFFNAAKGRENWNPPMRDAFLQYLDPTGDKRR